MALSRLLRPARIRLASSQASAASMLRPQRHYSTPVSIPNPLPSSNLLNVSTLSNGVQVATSATPGAFSAAGVFINTGSRYEIDDWRGCSHVVDRMAFKTTQNRTMEQMTLDVQSLGGQFFCSSSREFIKYQASSYTHSMPSALSLLSDTVLNPLITQSELDAQRDAILYEIAEIKTKPELILPEYLHEAAYRGNTLGNPLLCPEERLAGMGVEEVKGFMRTWYRPERITVVGAGVEHDDFRRMVEDNFGHLSPSPSLASLSAASPKSTSTLSNIFAKPDLSSSTSVNAANASTLSGAWSPVTPKSERQIAESAELADAKARYTGGSMYLESPEQPFTHVYVAFEGVPLSNDDVYTLATLQSLLGGGSSFSQGGPGKGLYSRLYTSVLNQYREVDFCSAFHYGYFDSGIFGIAIATTPEWTANIPRLIAFQLDQCRSAGAGILGGRGRGGATPGPLTEIELERAKNALKSNFVMALESRLIQVEELGGQVRLYGREMPIEESLAKIDAVTLKDIRTVAERVFSSKPTIVAQGQVDKLVDTEDQLKKFGFGGR